MRDHFTGVNKIERRRRASDSYLMVIHFPVINDPNTSRQLLRSVMLETVRIAALCSSSNILA